MNKWNFIENKIKYKHQNPQETEHKCKTSSKPPQTNQQEKLETQTTNKPKLSNKTENHNYISKLVSIFQQRQRCICFVVFDL